MAPDLHGAAESFADSNREKFAVGLVELFYDHAPAAIVRNFTAIAADELAKEALQVRRFNCWRCTHDTYLQAPARRYTGGTPPTRIIKIGDAAAVSYA